MTGTIEQQNGEKNFFDRMKELFDEVGKKIESVFNSILESIGLKEKKEQDQLNESITKELKSLQNVITDNIVDSNEATLLKLLGDSVEFKDWFNRLSSDLDNDIKNKEIVSIFQLLDDSYDSGLEITKDELSNIASICKKKYDLCSEVMKEYLDPKLTKKEILEVYNELEKGDEDITKDKIIEKINNNRVLEN